MAVRQRVPRWQEHALIGVVASQENAPAGFGARLLHSEAHTHCAWIVVERQPGDGVMIRPHRPPVMKRAYTRSHTGRQGLFFQKANDQRRAWRTSRQAR